MKYEHKGVSVQFNEQKANFSAVINGVTCRAPSFDAIKRKIDAANAIKFAPFTAIREDDSTVRSCHVIGLQKNLERWRISDLSFVIEADARRGTRLEVRVIPDNNSNRKTLSKIVATRLARLAEIKKFDDEIGRLELELKYVYANDYKVKP